jgi:hypothetical protein
MIERTDRPRRVPEILTQDVSGNTVLLKPDNGQYYSLEEVSGVIWARCDGEHTVDAIIAAVSREYEAEPAEVEADVLEFLGELLNEQLVTTDP